ncbi:MAG: c-type cytochrome [Myxococcaceae bacterium]|nr:c-type cytochrome [Myxococcaceae bacterium]
MKSDRPGVLHVFDDIEEADNHLPLWWLATLFGAIVFSAGYWLMFHTMHQAKSPMEEYREEAEAHRAQLKQSGPSSDGVLLALSKDPQVLSEGEKVFKTSCVACHGQNGEGVVGPNLTDRFWIHGGGPLAVHASISHGYPDKGMAAWGPVLGQEKVTNVSAWVLAQRNKNLPGKAPQGTEEP